MAADASCRSSNPYASKFRFHVGCDSIPSVRISTREFASSIATFEFRICGAAFYLSLWVSIWPSIMFMSIHFVHGGRMFRRVPSSDRLWSTRGRTRISIRTSMWRSMKPMYCDRLSAKVFYLSLIILLFSWKVVYVLLVHILPRVGPFSWFSYLGLLLGFSPAQLGFSPAHFGSSGWLFSYE